MKITQDIKIYSPNNQNEEIVLRLEDYTYYLDIKTKDVTMTRKIDEVKLGEFLKHLK